MSGKKLLYVGNKLSNAGKTVTSIETLGRLLQDEGYVVYMASSKSNKLLRLLDMMLATIKYSRKVSAVLIDTYSTQNFYFAITIGNICRLLRIPYIPILRGGDLPSRLERSKGASWKYFNGAKTNVAPSGYLLEAFKKAGYSNLSYIPNTIEIENYPFKKRLNLKPKLLWVRSFAAIYNPELAVVILEGLREKSYDATLCMVGPDKDGSLEQCKAIAERKNLPVNFTGRLDKKAWIALSSEYDIFINTTNFDNTPVSVIEAMALGLPVISTDVGGIPYLLENGEDAIVVPSKNKEAFINAIEDLIVDNERAIQISKNARQKVENFDWQKVKPHWKRILEA